MVEASKHTSIGVICEAEAFGASGLGIIDEAKALNLAGAAEDVGDLLFREACGGALANAIGGARAAPAVCRYGNHAHHMGCCPQKQHAKVVL